MQNIPIAPPTGKTPAHAVRRSRATVAQTLGADGDSSVCAPLTPQARLLCELRDAERMLAEVEVHRLGRHNDEKLCRRVNAARDRVLAIRRALREG